ncbi:hypothetical protein RB653_009234 [Dictyostelium firmibasis]|uniref:N-acetyltransferase domain-containing protein n=1 Tax=Dictyostelium firmibasis TaxID=79012 RepID=A0AAN7U1L1_9MYCE
MVVRIVEGYEKVEEVKILFKEYVEWLNIDLSFQNFSEEFDSLPGKYSLEKDGRLYLAYSDDSLAGCVGLRKIDIKIKEKGEEKEITVDESVSTINNEQKICEIKRLYVKSEFRGLKIGKLLVERLINDAKEQNYDYMVLDTLKTLTTAISIYKSYGFIEFDPYYFNPNADDVTFLKLKLK